MSKNRAITPHIPLLTGVYHAILNFDSSQLPLLVCEKRNGEMKCFQGVHTNWFNLSDGWKIITIAEFNRDMRLSEVGSMLLLNQDERIDYNRMVTEEESLRYPNQFEITEDDFEFTKRFIRYRAGGPAMDDGRQQVNEAAERVIHRMEVYLSKVMTVSIPFKFLHTSNFWPMDLDSQWMQATASDHLPNAAAV